MSETPRIESRGIRCMECKILSDLKADLALSETGFGRCAVPFEHFVSFLMARNCMDFEPAAPEVVAARDRWAEEYAPMFWRRK